MAEEAKKDDEELQPRNNSMAAFSDKLKDLEEALSLLYIPRNLSGRLKFKDKWPEVAQYLFGDELIDYDINGFKDLDRRAELEEEANDRRIRIKQTINEIVDKSVDAGSLMFDYVGGVIDEYGAQMSKYLYAEDVIERVRPGVLAASEASAQNKPEEKNNAALVGASSVDEKPADDLQDTQTVSSVSDELDANIDEADDMNETAVLPNKEDGDEDVSLRAPDEKLSAEEKSLLSNAADIPDTVKPIETPSPTQQAPLSEAPKAPPKPVSEDPADSVRPIDTTKPQTPEEVAPFLSEDPEKVKAQAGLSPDTANIPAPQEGKVEVAEKTAEPTSDMKPATTAEPKVDALGDQEPVDVTPDSKPTEAASSDPAPQEAFIQEQPVSAPQPAEAPKPTEVTAAPKADAAPPAEAKPTEAEQAASQETSDSAETPDILKSPAVEEVPAAADQKPEKVEELTVQQAAKAEKGVYMAMFNALAKAG